MQNGQKSLFEVRFRFLRWLGGFGGGILIRAPKVPFSVPQNGKNDPLLLATFLGSRFHRPPGEIFEWFRNFPKTVTYPWSLENLNI